MKKEYKTEVVASKIDILGEGSASSATNSSKSSESIDPNDLPF